MYSFLKSFFSRPREGSTVCPRTTTRTTNQADIPACFRLGQLKGHDIYEINIEDLQAHYRNGDFSSMDYVKFCLERIQKIDYYLECVIETNPDALEIASSMDEERRHGISRGPLHGIPILVKDNMATKDKMQTTAGSWALLGSVVPRDAHIISQLRQSGAVIIGHSNMTEWAFIRSMKYSGAYSPRGLEVRNPFDLSKSPYGSSTGSAVAVSANIVPLSFGTETDSSIIGPAGINRIIGIKPTMGLTPRRGILPISEHMDTVGSFGRTLYDAVLGLNAIIQSDPADKATISETRVQELDYTKYICGKNILKGARFGLPWKRCWEKVEKDQIEVAQKVLDEIELLGGHCIRTDFPSAEERIPEDGEWDWEYGDPDKSEFTVVKIDAYNGINAYLPELSGTNIKCVEDVIAYNEENAGTQGAYPGDHSAFPSGQDNLHEIVQTKGIRDDVYGKALEYIQQKSRQEGIDGALKHEEGDLDALLLCDRNGVGQQMAAQAGYPIISIPIGVDADGLPVALSVQHSAWRESDLIKWASAIEDLVHDIMGSRRASFYRNHLSKNIPVFE